MRQDADDGRGGSAEPPGTGETGQADSPGLPPAPELNPVTLEELRAAAQRWQDQPAELERVLKALAGEGDNAVPSYRVGAAESPLLFNGLDGLGEIVEDTLNSLYDDIERQEAAEESAEAKRRWQEQRDLIADVVKRIRVLRWRGR